MAGMGGMFQGVVASVVASLLFGVMYYLSPRLAPLDGEQIFGWRVLMTLPFTTALLWWRREPAQLVALLARVRRTPALAAGLLLSAALLGVQLWLFLWAPLQGRALPVSLGYFLLPLTLVITGRLLFQEQLTPCQRLATLLAALGVGWELWRAGGLSWETWLVALGYPVYFSLRRWLGTGHMAGHWLDMALLVPAACYFVLRSPSSLPWLELSHLQALLPALGLVSALAMALYMAAAQRLSLGLFGLLSYVEPVLLALAALALGEQLAPGQEPMYALIMAAVGLLVLEGGGRLAARTRR